MASAPPVRPVITSRNWLEEAKQKRKVRPTAAIIYGGPGIGKTSMAAFAPSPIFLSDYSEDGVGILAATGLIPEVSQMPPLEKWRDVIDQLKALETGEHEFKTLVVDTLGGVETLMHQYTINQDFGGDKGEKGFAGYGRGAKVATSYVRDLLNAIDRVRDTKGMSVLILAHAKIATRKNPDGPDYDRWAPVCEPPTWEVFERWADMVLFCDYVTVVAGTSDPMKKGKARGGEDRVIRTTNAATFVAKNRHNLPPEISMGGNGQEAWSNLLEAIKTGRQAN